MKALPGRANFTRRAIPLLLHAGDERGEEEEKPFVAAFRSFGFGWAALGPFVVELKGSGLDASAHDSFLFQFPCPSGSIPAR